ncbi:MAG: hypothetical protein QXG05_03850 [Nitrososphaerota archaeon]
MNNYSVGRNAEYAIKRMLIGKGFSHIIRSAGSHTPVDLIASDGNQLLAIQVKKGRYISKQEVYLLIEWAYAFKARPMLARKKDGRWILKEVGMPTTHKEARP